MVVWLGPKYASENFLWNKNHLRKIFEKLLTTAAIFKLKLKNKHWKILRDLKIRQKLSLKMSLMHCRVKHDHNS